MALKLDKKPAPKTDSPDDEDVNGEGDAEVGPNDHMHEPVDAAAGYGPRVVKTPMHDGADVNPEIAQQQEKALRSEESGDGPVKKPDVKKAVLRKGGPGDQVANLPTRSPEAVGAQQSYHAQQAMKLMPQPMAQRPSTPKEAAQAKIAAGPTPNTVVMNQRPTTPEDRAMSGKTVTMNQRPTSPAETHQVANLPDMPKPRPVVQVYNPHATPPAQPQQPKAQPMLAQKSIPNVRLLKGEHINMPLDPVTPHAKEMQRANVLPQYVQHQAHVADKKVIKMPSDPVTPRAQAAQAAGVLPQYSARQARVAENRGKTIEMPNDPVTPRAKEMQRANVLPQYVAHQARQAAQPKPNMVAMKSIKPSVRLAKAIKGAGSRGGVIAYHTKSGAAVYQSKVKKQAPSFSQMAHNWTNNAHQAEKAGKPAGDHHATAAKQHLAAAFYQHHAGDTVAAKEHLAAAEHHHSKAKALSDPGWGDIAKEHKVSGRTMKWIDKNMKSTHEMVHGKASDAVKKSLAEDFEAITPGNSIGGNMSNEVEELFKSELGASNASAESAITKCVHCEHDLTKSDLRKGLGTHFVADDNDQPHDGGTGQVEPSRASGGKENDEIAPLLKGLKGSEAGDGEEFVISKSEMSEMGMTVDGMEDGWYTITKGEMKKLGASEHIGYLANRKTEVAKSMKPEVIAKGGTNARATQDGPHGYSPRAGGATGNGGNPLISWSEGSDKEIAAYIAKSGGYGEGSDESIKTQGRGFGEG
jgi:hypothetical protein